MGWWLRLGAGCLAFVGLVWRAFHEARNAPERATYRPR